MAKSVNGLLLFIIKTLVMFHFLDIPKSEFDRWADFGILFTLRESRRTSDPAL